MRDEVDSGNHSRFYSKCYGKAIERWGFFWGVRFLGGDNVYILKSTFWLLGGEYTGAELG